MEPFLLIVAMLILTFWSGYFSGSEAALFSLPATRIKSYRNDTDPRKRLIASLVMRPRDLLVTIFTLNTLVNILLQNVAANFFGDLSSWTLKVGVPLIITLVFGEILPKYIGLQHNVKFSYRVAPVINALQNSLTPIRNATIAITAPISRLMFFYLQREPEISSEEMQHILKTSQAHGIFNADEGELIAGYLRLQEDEVRDLMWPREDIIFYDIQEPISKLIHLFVEQSVSRVPVCDQDLNNLLGIITAKQFLVYRDKISSPRDLIPLLKKPLYAPESTPARILLKRFEAHNKILAMVVDEYGSITGLITREDLIEVVIGEISDKRDQKNLFTRSGKNEIIASGKLELEDFNKIFGSELVSHSHMTTIGGWLTEQLGEIPKTGSKYELNHFLFHVLAASPNRIRRLYIRRIM